MKLVTYRASIEAAARLGVISGDLVLDAALLGEAFGEAVPDSMLGLIDAGKPGLAALAALLAGCNTVAGMGKDISNAGDSIENAAKKK